VPGVADALAGGVDPAERYDVDTHSTTSRDATTALGTLLRHCFAHSTQASWPEAVAIAEVLFQRGADANAALSPASRLSFTEAVAARVSMPGDFEQAARWAPLYALALAHGGRPDVFALVTWARLGNASITRQVLQHLQHEARASRGQSAEQPRQLPSDAASAVLNGHVRAPYGDYSPLLAAVESGDVATAEVLLSAGADPNYSPGEVGGSFDRPLTLAVQRQDAEMVGALLTAGADPSSCRADTDATPALAIAASLSGGSDGAAACAALLVVAGANVNACDAMGVAPLHLAVLSGAFDVAEMLVAAGADRLARSRDGRRPADMLGGTVGDSALSDDEAALDASAQLHRDLTWAARRRLIALRAFVAVEHS
jgi:hypothetical protein